MVSQDENWSGLTIAAYRNFSDLLEMLLSHLDIKINKTTYAEGAAEIYTCYQWTDLDLNKPSQKNICLVLTLYSSMLSVLPITTRYWKLSFL